MATPKLSAKEAAKELGTDARTLRKFIRSQAEKGTLPIAPCGQGNRYEFTKNDIRTLKKTFIAWSASTGEKKPKVVDAKKHAPNTPDGGAEPETDDIVDELTGELDDELETAFLDEDDEDLIDIEELNLELED